MITSADAISGDTQEADALYCPHCGYDLRTLATDACPECGGAVDVEELKKSQVPWTYRGEIGFLRAFWRTAWQVTGKTRRFSQEVCRPVDLREALRFRRWMVVWLVVSLVLPLIVISAAIFFQGASFDSTEWWWGFGWWDLLRIVAVVLLVPFVYVWTGVHTYWFHPRHLSIEQQNRAVALSYYACGPLAFFPVFLWMGCAGLLLLGITESARSEALFALFSILAVVGFTPAVIMPIAFWRVAWAMAHRAAKRGWAGQATLAIGLPIVWLLLAGLILIAIPASVAYVALIFYTLWW